MRGPGGLSSLPAEAAGLSVSVLGGRRPPVAIALPPPSPLCRVFQPEQASQLPAVSRDPPSPELPASPGGAKGAREEGSAGNSWPSPALPRRPEGSGAGDPPPDGGWRDGPGCRGRAGGQASSLTPSPCLAPESPPQPLPFCSQRSHSHNHLLLILSATSIKLFVETN